MVGLIISKNVWKQIKSLIYEHNLKTDTEMNYNNLASNYPEIKIGSEYDGYI